MTAPDAQEECALNDAEAALVRFLPGCPQPRSLAAVAISAWIMSRARQAAGVRLNENVIFDFDHAKLKGFIEAALPDIAEQLGETDLSASLFDLSKDQIIAVFAAGCLGASRAAMAFSESSQFPFDDPIPY